MMAAPSTASSASRAALEFITVNGVRIAYADTGGAGDPLVLVHGSWGSHHNWDAVVPGLAQHFRVVAYDRRGHSDSERPPGLAAVLGRIESGDHAGAAESFVDEVALGPGSWTQLPDAMRQMMAGNAPTFLDEERDPGSHTVDETALARFSDPVLHTTGDKSPPIFSPVSRRLNALLPRAVRVTYTGAGHIPHVTHPEQYVAQVVAFTDSVGKARR
jgi:pimeloyl-ACP methyl ester carboxylesterase